MRAILSLALAAAAAFVPAGTSPVIPALGSGQDGGSNAQAARRPLGPNARAAQRQLGPNGAIAQGGKLNGGPIPYPSCAAAGAVRATPVRRGEPGYGRHLDSDGDGVACE